MAFTYKEVLKKAESYLKKGENVVLDATFKTRDLRNKVKKLAEETNSNYVFLYCNCPEEKVKKYLETRVKKRSVSDGRWEIYIKQKDSFEKLEQDECFVEIDVSNKSFEYQIKVFNEIFNTVCGG